VVVAAGEAPPEAPAPPAGEGGERPAAESAGDQSS
jgi:hypothetical protein